MRSLLEVSSLDRLQHILPAVRPLPWLVDLACQSGATLLRLEQFTRENPCQSEHDSLLHLYSMSSLAIFDPNLRDHPANLCS